MSLSPKNWSRDDYSKLQGRVIGQLPSHRAGPGGPAKVQMIVMPKLQFSLSQWHQESSYLESYRGCAPVGLLKPNTTEAGLQISSLNDSDTERDSETLDSCPSALRLAVYYASTELSQILRVLGIAICRVLLACLS